MSGVLGGLLASFSPVSTSFESIATASGTGSSGVITFSSIPSTYKHLQIRSLNRCTTGSLNMYMQFNGITTSTYAYHILSGNGTTTTASGSINQTFMLELGLCSSATSMAGASIIDIIDYASTTKNKTIRTFYGLDTNGTVTQKIALSSGLWRSTDAVSSITITANGGNFASDAQFALYGIKGA